MLVFALVSAGAQGVQMRAFGLLELELQAVVCGQRWCCGPNSGPLQYSHLSLPPFCKYFNKYLLNFCMGAFEILSLPGWPWRRYTTPVAIFTQHLWNRKKDRFVMLGQGTVGKPMPIGVLGAVVAWLRLWVFTAFIQSLLWAVLVHWSNKWVNLEWFFEKNGSKFTFTFW